MPTSPSSASRLPVVLVAIALSCLFSLLTILQNPLLNNDAFGYLRAAEIFKAEGVGAVLDTYGWYAYSIFIALADAVLPGDLVHAAHVLNTLSYALLVHAFIGICAEYRDTPRLRWFAALAILGFPLVNEMRYFLIRDTAFWAFALSSLLYLMRFGRTGNLRDALCWCGALFAAIAFRLEGLLLLASAPLTLLCTRSLDPALRRRLGFVLLQVALGGLGLVVLLAFAAGIDLPGLAGYAYRYYLPLLGDLGGVMGESARRVSLALFTPENFPGTDNVAMGFVIVLFAYAFTVVANFFNALSLPLVVLLAYGWRRGFALPAHACWPLLAYLGGSALALLLFVLIMHFLTQRYTTLLSLLMLTLVPLVLDDLYSRASAAGAVRRFRVVLGMFALYFFVDSLVSFGYSKRYVEDAIAWTRGDLPADARLHTNNYAIAYGSGRVPAYDRIATTIEPILQESMPGDYLALDLKAGEADMRSWLDANPALEPVTEFANARGDAVRFYRHR